VQLNNIAYKNIATNSGDGTAGHREGGARAPNFYKWLGTGGPMG